jgi:hypothetical protein
MREYKKNPQDAQSKILTRFASDKFGAFDPYPASGQKPGLALRSGHCHLFARDRIGVLSSVGRLIVKTAKGSTDQIPFRM